MDLKKRQILVFTIGWLSYASTYLLRKPLGVVKSDLQSELKLSKTQLGWLDTSLLLPYALMQMLLGSLGDRLGSRRTYGTCLVLSALSMITFGHWSTFVMFVILLLLNGTAQSQCWPNCIKILGSWYPDDSRNTVFGMFGTCAFAGGIAGTALAVHLQTSYGWRSAFFIPSLVVLLLGLVVMVLFSQPNEVGIEVPGKSATRSGSSKTDTGLTVLQVWRIPMVPEVAVGVFCLKLVRYCMYMWLPMYLLKQLNYTKAQAGMFSTMFEIGGVFGSASIGIIIDKCFKGQTLLGTSMSVFLSSVALIFFTMTSHWGLAINSVCMFVAGAFNCGPDSILGGSVPAELGEMDGKNAAAAVAGFINGFGSIGTFLEGPIIGVLSDMYGWSSMFHLIIVLSLVGTVSVYRASFIHKSMKSSLNVAPVPVV